MRLIFASLLLLYANLLVAPCLAKTWYEDHNEVFQTLLARDESGIETFFHESWEKKPAVTTASAERLGDLFDQTHFNLALEANAGAYQDGPLIYEKDVVILKRVRNPEDGDWWSGRYPLAKDSPVTKSLVKESFKKGFTIVFNRMNYRSPHLFMLCMAMERTLGASVNVNLYMSPANSQGFEAHWDTMDVFVIQVQGSKIWRLYEPLVELGRPGDKYKPATKDLVSYNELEELTLNPGDVLFLPRGWIHEARTTDTDSMHLTIGVESEEYTWETLLRRCMSVVDDTLPVMKPFKPVRVLLDGGKYFVEIPWFRILELSVEQVARNLPSIFRRRMPTTQKALEFLKSPNEKNMDMLNMAKNRMADMVNAIRTKAMLPRATEVADAFADEIRKAYTNLQGKPFGKVYYAETSRAGIREETFHAAMSAILDREAMTEHVITVEVRKVLTEYRDSRAQWIRDMNHVITQHASKFSPVKDEL